MAFHFNPISLLTQNDALRNVKQQLVQLKEYEINNFNCLTIYQLMENRCLFCDQLLLNLWHYFGLTDSSLALVIVGGYGRKEVFPLSDLDILILSAEHHNALTQQKISDFLQFLWDCKFDLGQSVRTIDECYTEGKNEISIATNLLESRYLCGNELLWKQLQYVINKSDFWPLKSFFEAKMIEKNQRYQRYHNTAYNLEPDIKYSPGGLRDLHLLYWMLLRHFGTSDLQAILALNFIHPAEYQQLYDCQTFLFKVRFVLHLIAKRYDNRLSFEYQVKISKLLGYEGENNQAVEKFMSHYFSTLSNVSVITEMLLLHFREDFINKKEIFSIKQLDKHFKLVNNIIQLEDIDCFSRNPESIIDLFLHLIRYPIATIHSSTLRQLRLAIFQQPQELYRPSLAREKFIYLLKQPQAILRGLLPMHRYGVLGAYCHLWDKITGLMQFDLFHIYTVDEHTIRVLLKLESFLDVANKEAHPLCTVIFPALKNRVLLYVAALYHDIAKGRQGDHAALGAIDVYGFAKKHGFPEADAQTMAWLVHEHLLMSITAQRRDIHDPDVITNFATKVNNKTRLDYLTCLTVADIVATNETLWNSWKRSLIFTLYQYTEKQLSQGIETPIDHQEIVLQNRLLALNLLQNKLSSTEIKVNNVSAIWQRCPPDYFLRHTPKQLAWHAETLCKETLSKETLLKEILYKETSRKINAEANIIKVSVSNKFSRGATEIFIYCLDRANLFNHIICTLDNKKIIIHHAQIITSDDGYALDSIIVTETNGLPLKAIRRRELERSLITALRKPQAFSKQRQYNLLRNLQHFNVPTEIKFLNLDKKEHTALEILTLDREGLLICISGIFNELSINLCHAKISTIGEKVEDFFILTSQQGKALTSSQRDELSKKLYQYLQ